MEDDCLIRTFELKIYLQIDNPCADIVGSKCKEKGLYIRDVSNMGTTFGKYTIRIAIKDRITNQKMLKKLDKVLIEKY